MLSSCRHTLAGPLQASAAALALRAIAGGASLSFPSHQQCAHIISSSSSSASSQQDGEQQPPSSSSGGPHAGGGGGGGEPPAFFIQQQVGSARVRHELRGHIVFSTCVRGAEDDAAPASPGRGLLECAPARPAPCAPRALPACLWAPPTLSPRPDPHPHSHHTPRTPPQVGARAGRRAAPARGLPRQRRPALPDLRRVAGAAPRRGRGKRRCVRGHTSPPRGAV